MSIIMKARLTKASYLRASLFWHEQTKRPCHNNEQNHPVSIRFLGTDPARLCPDGTEETLITSFRLRREKRAVPPVRLPYHLFQGSDEEGACRTTAHTQRNGIASNAFGTFIEHRRHGVVLSQLSIDQNRFTPYGHHPVFVIRIPMGFTTSGFATKATRAVIAVVEHGQTLGINALLH